MQQHYSLAKAPSQTFKTVTSLRTEKLLGVSGEWIHIQRGILWYKVSQCRYCISSSKPINIPWLYVEHSLRISSCYFLWWLNGKIQWKISSNLRLEDWEAESTLSAVVQWENWSQKTLEKGILEREWKNPIANSIPLGKILTNENSPCKDITF